MKIQLFVLLIMSSIMILSLGGRFAIKEDLTIQIEINITGCLIILVTIISVRYTIDNRVMSHQIQSSDVSQKEPQSSQQYKEVQTSFNVQDNDCATSLPQNIINEQDDQFIQSEIYSDKDDASKTHDKIQTNKNFTIRKSSLKSEEHNQSFNDGDFTSNLEDIDLSFKKQRTMSLHLPCDLEDEPSRSRKVSFNEDINTVHRYRKNSRQEKRNYEIGEREIKQNKKKDSMEQAQVDGGQNQISIGKKKLKFPKTQQDKQDSKNKLLEQRQTFVNDDQCENQNGKSQEVILDDQEQ